MFETLSGLSDLYDGFFFDAFGVLVTFEGALPGARESLAQLRARGMPFVVVTNDASKSEDEAAAWYRHLGYDIAAHEVVSSGGLIAGALAAHKLAGGRCAVLGPASARALARAAPVELVPLDDGVDFDVLVLADESGYPVWTALDHAISSIVRMTRRGNPPTLVLANPDPVFPKSTSTFGVAAGAIAALIEAALVMPLGAAAPAFVRLGKPHAPIFEAARRRIGLPRDARICMVGDNLMTDIAGAKSAGLGAALVGQHAAGDDDNAAPDHLLRDLRWTHGWVEPSP